MNEEYSKSPGNPSGFIVNLLFAYPVNFLFVRVNESA